jgi:hypothetical protein
VIERELPHATPRRRMTILRLLEDSSGLAHPRNAAGDHATT